MALRNQITEVPQLLGHSYNAIVVGRPSGVRSRGGTWFDGAGRTRPDIVAPDLAAPRGDHHTVQIAPASDGMTEIVSFLLSAPPEASRFYRLRLSPQ